MIKDILIVLLILTAGYLGINYFKKNQSIVNIKPAESMCRVDSDCVMAIDLNSCCGCPVIVEKNKIGTMGLVEYVEGKDYSLEKINTCDGGMGVCAPCLLLGKPVCNNGKCEERATFNESDTTNGWYYGSFAQKKEGTPKDWEFVEAGRSSCWHEPGRECN